MIGDVRNAAGMSEIIQDAQDALNNIPVATLRPNAFRRENFDIGTFDMGIESDTLASDITGVSFVSGGSSVDTTICTVEFSNINLQYDTASNSAAGVLAVATIDVRRCTSFYHPNIDGSDIGVPEGAAVLEFWIEAKVDTTWYDLPHTQRFVRCNQPYTFAVDVDLDQLDYELRRNVPIATLITEASLTSSGVLSNYDKLCGVRVRCRGWINATSFALIDAVEIPDPNFDIAAGSHLVVSKVRNGALEVL